MNLSPRRRPRTSSRIPQNATVLNSTSWRQACRCRRFSLAAAALGVSDELILKTLLFAGDDGHFVVVIANGMRRIDMGKLADAAAMRKPRPASPDDVIAVIGYPAGRRRPAWTSHICSGHCRCGNHGADLRLWRRRAGAPAAPRPDLRRHTVQQCARRGYHRAFLTTRR